VGEILTGRYYTDVHNQPHAFLLPQLLQGNELPVLIQYTGVWMGPRNGLDVVETKKISFFLPRIELPFQLAA
jgi:hypothetical protein